MKKLSLFSGILGDDLASEWAGIETICCVEIDLFCQAVIRKHKPNMPIIGDIKNVTKEKVKEVSGYDWVDIISGGDPCQPRSIAGKQRGKADDRDLWEDMFRVIQEFKPTWVVNENPTGRLTMDFHKVLSDLEGIGYETRSFVIPACAINAPHRRDRVFILANLQGSNVQISTQKENHRELCQCIQPRGHFTQEWIQVAPKLCRVDDGFPTKLDRARLNALGNTNLPQVYYLIYKAIVEVESDIEL